MFETVEELIEHLEATDSCENYATVDDMVEGWQEEANEFPEDDFDAVGEAAEDFWNLNKGDDDDEAS